MSELSAEDNKLKVLARSAAARVGSRQGAAVRDLDGRTYAAGSVALTNLRLSPLAVCLAMAITSGARGLEAVLVLGAARDDLSESDLLMLTEFAGDQVMIHVLD